MFRETQSKQMLSEKKNGNNKLAQCRVATKLHFVINAVPAECDKGKRNQTAPPVFESVDIYLVTGLIVPVTFFWRVFSVGLFLSALFNQIVFT